MTDWPLLEETLTIFGDRDILDTDTFRDLADEYKAQSGRLAGVWDTKFVAAVYGELLAALREGQSVREVVPRLQMHLDHYASAHGVEIFSGTRWSPAYADTVFRTNVQAAYAAGRYSEQFSPDAVAVTPYWMFAAIGDDRTRPQHMALDGKVFRKDDPMARYYLPPLGFSCRCSTVMLDDADIKDGGYRVMSGAGISSLPMRDLDGNPVLGREGAPLTVGLPPEGWRSDRVGSLVPTALRGGTQPAAPHP